MDLRYVLTFHLLLDTLQQVQLKVRFHPLAVGTRKVINFGRLLPSRGQDCTKWHLPASLWSIL